MEAQDSPPSTKQPANGHWTCPQTVKPSPYSHNLLLQKPLQYILHPEGQQCSVSTATRLWAGELHNQRLL